jgi:hypothetical protein
MPDPGDCRRTVAGTGTSSGRARQTGSTGRTQREHDGTVLAPRVRDLVAAVAAALPDGGAELRAQLVAATVADGGATHLDVTVPDESPRLEHPDGPLPTVATVVDDAGELVGEVQVCVRDGLMVGVEQTWYGDTPPTGWPDLAHVRVG